MPTRVYSMTLSRGDLPPHTVPQLKVQSGKRPSDPNQQPMQTLRLLVGFPSVAQPAAAGGLGCGRLAHDTVLVPGYSGWLTAL